MDNKNHILVVDDDDRIRNLLKEYLDEKNLLLLLKIPKRQKLS